MDLDMLVNNYEPNSNIIDMIRQVPLVLLVGITGAGKDTIQNELFKTGKFERIITSTTRAPRMNDGVMERDGVEYYFFSLEEAAEKIRTKQYFEVAKVHERIYGVTADEIARLHASGKVALGDADYQGAAYYKKYVPDTTTIFIVPPNFDIWRERIGRRYDSLDAFNQDWPVRRQSAIAELRHALQVPYYHVVINGDLDKAVEAVLHVAETAEVYTRKDDEARLAARDLLEAIERSPSTRLA